MVFTTRGLNQQTIGNLHPTVVRILWEYIRLTIKNRNLSCNGAFFKQQQTDGSMIRSWDMITGFFRRSWWLT